MHASLSLILGHLSKYADTLFHVLAVSRGGTYVLDITSIIHEENQALATTFAFVTSMCDLFCINLPSAMLSNRVADPCMQVASVSERTCEGHSCSLIVLLTLRPP